MQNQQVQNQLAEQSPPEQDWASYMDIPVGQILTRTRCHYGLSLADVESALRIRTSQLSALEEGRIDQLPGRVYAIGFVRAYSEFLGLDGDKMVYLFKSQMIGNKPKPELSFPVSASESKSPNPFILLGSFAGLALMIGLYMTTATGRVETASIPVPPAAVQTAAAELFGPVVPADLAVIAPAAGIEGPVERVVIEARDNAWVEIRNQDGDAILSRILKEGDSYIVPDETGLVMDTGNIGVLDIVVDGAMIEPLGEPGDVRRSVSLDPDSLVPTISGMPDDGAQSPLKDTAYGLE